VRKGILRKCNNCDRYTLKQDKCPYCGGVLKIPHPPKFSPEDKYGEYRRKLKFSSILKSLQDK